MFMIIMNTYKNIDYNARDSCLSIWQYHSYIDIL